MPSLGSFADKISSGSPLPNGDLPLDNAPRHPVDLAIKENASAAQKDSWWFRPESIDGERWDQEFPYQLLVVRQGKDKYERVPGWKFTLPIPPESMTITMPFASTTHVTIGGIVEDNAGAPIRQIEFSGTTGVLPKRPSADLRGEATITETIFAGTIAAARQAEQAARAAVADVTGAQPALNLIPDEALPGLLPGTGYYQFRMLQRFLENYVEFRRTPDGADVALAWATWRDEAVYLVTPQSFVLRRAADSPLEYRYQMSLKAWRRVELLGTPSPYKPEGMPSRRDPDVLARILNTIEDARVALQDARAAVAAVAGDVDRVVFEPIRELALLTKDALAVPLAVADLPAAIIRDLQDTVLVAAAAKRDFLNFPDTLGKRLSAAKEDIATFSLVRDEMADRRTHDAGVGRPLAAGAARQQSPAFDIFVHPEEHAPFLSLISLARLQVPTTIARQIRDEVKRVRDLRRPDLESRRRQILSAAESFERLVGSGDATVARVYGTPIPATTRPLGRRAFRVAAALNSVATAYAQASAWGADLAEAAKTRHLAGRAASARASGVPFVVARSKFPVPFPYGATLERLALRYLGDPNRWHEIAALNNLRAPYVDEAGVERPLLVPGAGNRVVVADDPALHAGQVAWVGAATVIRTRRTVVSVTRRDGEATLELDGDADLERFTTLESAVVTTFAPGTTNSMSLIYIPSSREPGGNFRVEGIPASVANDPLAAVGGIDLLLTDKNDLVVTEDGDTRWAVGMTNIVQQFRLLVDLQRGALLQHPGAGNPLRVGQTAAEMSAGDAVRGLRAALAADPAFAAIDSVHVDRSGPVTRVSVQAEVAGTDLTLPLSVEMA